jgi:uncharacterized protein YegL
LLCKTVDREIIRNTPGHKGDWMPLLFIMTDGSPSDIQKFRQQVPEVKKEILETLLPAPPDRKLRTVT